jgi:hypothetical protein
MPDSSAGTKELYFAWIARVEAVCAPGFHSHIVQMFHVEHFRSGNAIVPEGQIKIHPDMIISTWNIGTERKASASDPASLSV